MKHLLPLALLCGLCAPAALGQTVTILDKEGIAHKFNTDYVKEITSRSRRKPRLRLIQVLRLTRTATAMSCWSFPARIAR